MAESPENLILKYSSPGSSYPKDTGGEGTGFYRSWKPILIKEGFYDFLFGLSSYLDFQKKLSILAEEPVGVSLALSCMVEVNVAGGILLQKNCLLNENLDFASECSENQFQTAASLWEGFRNPKHTIIYAVGVSEPGWEGKLRKLSSNLENGFLSGTKSFITNGGEADVIFWVTKQGLTNPVYQVKREREITRRTNSVWKEETFFTDFTKEVSHLKLSLCEYSITDKDLVLENYGNLGMELRLKELLSLVSLLIGKTKKISFEYQTVAKEREKLMEWRESFLSDCQGNPSGDFLLSGFPYPTDALLLALTSVWNLSTPKELSSIDPDYQLFVWEDSFTNYLVQKKNRNL